MSSYNESEKEALYLDFGVGCAKYRLAASSTAEVTAVAARLRALEQAYEVLRGGRPAAPDAPDEQIRLRAADLGVVSKWVVSGYHVGDHVGLDRVLRDQATRLYAAHTAAADAAKAELATLVADLVARA